MDANTVLQFAKEEIAKLRAEFEEHVKGTSTKSAAPASTVAPNAVTDGKVNAPVASGFKQIK